jgi:hypothetical protein
MMATTIMISTSVKPDLSCIFILRVINRNIIGPVPQSPRSKKDAASYDFAKVLD